MIQAIWLAEAQDISSREMPSIDELTILVSTFSVSPGAFQAETIAGEGECSDPILQMEKKEG